MLCFFLELLYNNKHIYFYGKGCRRMSKTKLKQEEKEKNTTKEEKETNKKVETTKEEKKQPKDTKAKKEK